MSAVSEFIAKNFKDTIRYNPDDEGNLIGLPYPYTTPCANEGFTEMYYWDTYFTNAGLIAEGNVQQAKNNADNVRFLIHKYGFMPNGSRTFYLGNTQPPFYYKMVEDIFEKTGDKAWLKESYDALVKEYGYWQTNRTAPNGLNVYGPHKDYTKEYIEEKYDYFKYRYRGFEAKNEEEKSACAHTIVTMCESGWDCCTRFENAGEYYNPVDLNSLLYGLEKSMENFSKILENGEAALWSERAARRKEKMLEIMFDNKRGIFLDWNYKEERFSPVVSAASLYPLFVKLDDTPEKAIGVLKNELFLKYGVSACVPGEYDYSLQWDYPNVWAPLQYIAYAACKNYGFDSLAERVAETYIKLLDENFAQTGNLWEKYDGLTGKVANADYNAPKMMGWTAGVYMYFCAQSKHEAT
mgnify:CR=1 FL=1